MRTASRFLALTWVALLGALLFGGCGGDDHAHHLADPSPDASLEEGSGGRRVSAGGSDSEDAGDASDGHAGKGGTAGKGGAGGISDAGADADGSLDGTGGAPVANCGSLTCRGHGHCVINDNVPECLCDTGYKLNVDGGTECVVDESCIRLKHLQVDNCRYSISPSAVGMFFAVDYCAGTAVLPEKLGDPATAFKILEDGADVKSDTESYATVIPRGVESYVTFVLDVSKSLIEDKGLVTEVIAELRSVIQQLKPAPGAPPVGVSILVFGYTVKEYLPFTTNIDAVDAKLASIEADPAAVGDLVNPNGTSLIEAAERGIHSVERIQALRDGVADGGVLTTGAVVVVSDGKDKSGYPLPTDLLKNTLVNVISIGISDQVDDQLLTTIGRDGSFLAPAASDRTQAFSEIAQRVKEYPKRSYLLGYCSQATKNVHSVTITLANGVKPKEDAVCSFNATFFSGNPQYKCNADYFSKGCDTRACGGLMACGACSSNGDCCSDGQCQAPSVAAYPDAIPDCRNQDVLCARNNQVCVPRQGTTPLAYQCAPPVAIGAQCDDQTKKCAPGAAICTTPAGGGPRVCVETGYGPGEECADPANSSLHPATVCASLNCSQIKEGGLDPFTCLEQARVFDRCGGTTANAVCEPGASCDGAHCKARQVAGCAKDSDCVTGRCESNVCVSSGACYFSWSEKMSSQ